MSRRGIDKTNNSIEKLLSNGDKWEPELAAAIRADSPYR